MTRDMRHMTCDTFGGENILSKFQLPSSYRLWFMILWRSGGKGWLTELMNELMNDEAVYRTAPATPGLLISRWQLFQASHSPSKPFPLSIYFHPFGKNLAIISHFHHPFMQASRSFDSLSIPRAILEQGRSKSKFWQTPPISGVNIPTKKC